MRKIAFGCLMFICSPLLAKTLTKITILPPANGYALTSNTATAQLSAQCTYDDLTVDNCTASSITLTWGSGDPGLFSVSSSGLITGAGSSVYYAPDVYAYSGTVLGHHPINVYGYTVTTLTSRPETTSFQIVVGTTVLLSAADNVSAQNNPAGDYCAWTNSDPTKVSVNNIGEVTGVAAGSATVTCTINGVTVGRSVTVIAPTLTNNTWYVRPNGGTRWDSSVTAGQCNGLTNADYPGTGTNQNCAFNQFMYLFTDESSSTVYTGAVQAGDVAIVYPSTTPYNIVNKSVGVPWVTNVSGAITIPSGTVGQRTRIFGSNYGSGCSVDPDHAGNRTALTAFQAGPTFYLFGAQNVDVECIDLGTDQDCNLGLTGIFDFTCPNGSKPLLFMSDDFTANLSLVNMRIHGGLTAWTGTPGPGVTATNTTSEMNYLDGWNFDNPYGFNGNRTDGFTAQGLNSNYNGCTEEVAKSVSSASRDGAGNLDVTFSANQVVNYNPTTNLTLTGMLPSDLNGTFPVTSITFNQQSVNITGGTCALVNPDIPPIGCTFTTNIAPAFVTGEFVQIVGASPSFLNGNYEVYSTSTAGTFSFLVIASPYTRVGWTTGTISSGGTAATASSLVASAAGSSETASTVGTASHVHPARHCYDQNDGGNANGDGVGTGNNTIGSWFCNQCSINRNLQDGWDMLHSAMASSTFTNSTSTGNEGAAAKFGNADVGLVSNNVMIATGGAALAFDVNFPPDYNQYVATPYRAGDGFPIGDRAWSNMVITNNTLDVGFGTIIDDSCDDAIGCAFFVSLGISSFNAQNNIFLGFLDTNNPEFTGSAPGVYLAESSTPAPWAWNNNLGYNVRNTPSGNNNLWTTNPLVKIMIPDISTFLGESVVQSFNMNLQSGSPAIGAGIANSFVPTTDNAGNPQTSPVTSGALVFEASAPTTVVKMSNGKLSGSGYIK